MDQLVDDVNGLQGYFPSMIADSNVFDDILDIPFESIDIGQVQVRLWSHAKFLESRRKAVGTKERYAGAGRNKGFQGSTTFNFCNDGSHLVLDLKQTTYIK